MASSKRNLIDVPRDLDAVTHHDPSRETRGTDVGLKAGAVDKIWNAVRAMYRSGLHPGISLTVRRGGKVILDRAIGHARNCGPAEDRTTAPLLSGCSARCS